MPIYTQMSLPIEGFYTATISSQQGVPAKTFLLPAIAQESTEINLSLSSSSLEYWGKFNHKDLSLKTSQEPTGTYQKSSLKLPKSGYMSLDGLVYQLMSLGAPTVATDFLSWEKPLLPTLLASASKHPGIKSIKPGQTRHLSAVLHQHGAVGKLNPDWLTGYMGFPPDWLAT